MRITRRTMRAAFEFALRALYPARYQALKSPRGILLQGEPGHGTPLPGPVLASCGVTHSTKTLFNDLGAFLGREAENLEMVRGNMRREFPQHLVHVPTPKMEMCTKNVLHDVAVFSSHCAPRMYSMILSAPIVHQKCSTCHFLLQLITHVSVSALGWERSRGGLGEREAVWGVVIDVLYVCCGFGRL